MSSTIETTNNIICTKIECLNELIVLYLKRRAQINPEYLEEFETVSNEYKLESSKVLIDYFILLREYKENIEVYKNLSECVDENVKLEILQIKTRFNEKKDMYFKKYHSLIRKEDYGGKLDRLYKFLKLQGLPMMKSKRVNDPNIKQWREACKKLFHTYEDSILTKNVAMNDYERCTSCQSTMKVFSHLSSIICVKCGSEETLKGTVFEDEQFYYQEGKRNKHANYDPTKHSKSWLEKIQATENKDIPEEILNDINKYIEIYRIRNTDEITCELIREILSHTKHTDYNDHIPLIRKKITGVSPPLLTESEKQCINNLFAKVIKIYSEKKSSDKTNCFYHPYFIYKIIEHVLKGGSKKRRNAILSCIHLQQQPTLIKNDNMWRNICKVLNEITYVPTNYHT
jgi:hypothetical protein